MAKRRTSWEDTIFDADAIAEGSAGVNFALDGTLSQADSQGLTLTRCIGDLTFLSGTTAGANGQQRLSLGIGMASREAFTAGVLPDPESETEEPARGWVYRTVLGVTQSVQAQPMVRLQFDIRAQRRLDSGRLWVRVVNLDVGGTGFNILVCGIVRSLFLLP